MTKQRQDSTFLEVARAVFGAPELQAGFNSVKPLDSEVRAVLGESTPSSGLSFYLLASQSLRLEARELLVLLDGGLRENDERLSVIAEVARQVADCRTATVVAEGIEQTTDHAIGEVDLQLWSPEELFSRVLQLPSGFDAQLRTLAGIQRPDEFPYAFQERMARVHMVAGRQPAKAVVELSSYFHEWLGARRRHSPILLLGERGSGKSWQMLRFALDAYRHHQEQPWTYGPAFLIRLRDLVDLVEHASTASSVVCQYVFEQHPGLSAVFGGAATLGALFGSGHAVVLVDGFDEMDVVPTDARVRVRLTSLLLLLSKRTRFVLSSRAGHFSSLAALFAMPAWSGSTVGQVFETLEILPFDENRKVAYINDVATGRSAGKIREIFGFGRRSASPLQHALSICASHPGLLAQITDDLGNGVENPMELISEAIFSILVEFNLLHGRTAEDHRVVDDEFATSHGLREGKWVKLSADRRAELLGDLAWYMAERGVDTIDLANLPSRIRLEYRIADDALERDLRSQTVFELVTDSHREKASDVGGTSGGSKQGPRDHTEERQIAASSIVRFTLRSPEGENESVGESSVTGAYFLASHLVSRLLEPGPFGELPLSARLKYLGRLPLGPMGSAMLSEMLRSAGVGERRFGVEARRFVVGLAQGGGYQVFSPSYRYLVSNLLQLGGFSRDEAQLLDPWRDEVSNIVRCPLRKEMKDHKMALIPPPPMANSASKSEPFLLGVHEVTNDEYRRFVGSEPDPSDDDCTVQGPEWSVRRVTVAGSGDEKSRSDNHRLTNEYHLFFWLPTGRSSGNLNSASGNGGERTVYLPPAAIRAHPVTHVSWFAAAAFCDWLSLGEGFDRRYKAELHDALGWKASGSDDSKAEATGYGLPTRSQWIWAAKGGHEDLQRPWEAFPYYMAERGAGGGSQKPPRVVNDAAWARYVRYQEVMRAVLLGTGKQAREVLYDEPNDYGVSGLVGNVREWCQDTKNGEAEKTERLILGATGFLGEDTFDFEYKTSLYPRNTNPDVGLRVARSLRPSDIKVLRRREIEIATLEAES